MILPSVERDCPVCGATGRDAVEFLPENIDASRLSSFSFASRKEPEFMCHKLVRCTRCDVVYVPTPPEDRALVESYHSAGYDSGEDAEDAAESYYAALRDVVNGLPQRDAALEIGAGNGAFLGYLTKLGFKRVAGVEPSTAAINAADGDIRNLLISAPFDATLFARQQFDLICCFMTMEHVSDPRDIATSALRLLRPGGVFVTVTHDYTAAINRMLGRRSPIIDIEHLQLFSRRSIRKLFEVSGYSNIQVSGFSNTYAARYWIRLSPLPGGAKQFVARMADGLGIAGRRVTVDVGNTLAFGYNLKK